VVDLVQLTGAERKRPAELSAVRSSASDRARRDRAADDADGEPFSALDALTRSPAGRSRAPVQRDSQTVFMITHDVDARSCWPTGSS
jgi:ABC-type nitrate/sulfonate/bicarbonate transport system ATPase subunit